jgi:hypothetical protein
MKTIKVKLVDGFETVIWKESYVWKQIENRYNIEISEKPDYLLCSCFSGDFLKYDCIKIVVMSENITPDFNLYDYGVGFDFIDYGDRYLRLPNYTLIRQNFEEACKKHMNTDEYFLGKKKFCNFIYSNNVSDEIRNEFFNRLSEYKKVDSGGKIFNNVGGRISNKREFQKDYKFSIAFENSRKEGYVTEKIVDAWAAGTIPIYWGNTLIAKEFNPKAFINVFDFETIDDCIEYIKKADNDEKLYLSIQNEPILKDDSVAKLYYDNPDMLFDFFCSIFDKPIAEAKKIYNYKNGYTKFYIDALEQGWFTRNKMIHLVRLLRKIRNL